MIGSWGQVARYLERVVSRGVDYLYASSVHKTWRMHFWSPRLQSQHIAKTVLCLSGLTVFE